jgi:adenylyltransferase/sulfurtransferase
MTSSSTFEPEESMAEPLGSPNEIVVIPDTEHDRYATFGFLTWWDQQKMRDATVLVAGAGALGNEVLKNLALTGIGRLLIVDFDLVEAANLSRSVLFRNGDRGRSKAAVAAAAVRALNPDVATCALHGDLTRDLGLGVFRHVDAVVGCLDNREARLFVNRACCKLGKPWVDGALHEMLGEARVFWPGRGACYECTLGPADYQAMNMRYSCTSLARDLVIEGKVATTPTIASIIGGVQAQETLKLLHGLPVDPGRALVFNGLTNETYTTTYPFHDDCLSHVSCAPIVECPDLRSATTSVGEMLERVRRQLGADAVLELGFDLLVDFDCANDHPSAPVLQPVSQVAESAARCPVCGALRWPRQTHRIRGDETFLHQTLQEIGVPPMDVLCGHSGTDSRCFELTGDYGAVFDFRTEREE